MKMKQKSLFIIFKGLSVARNCLPPRVLYSTTFFTSRNKCHDFSNTGLIFTPEVFKFYVGRGCKSDKSKLFLKPKER